MKINRKTHLQIRFQNLVFSLLFLGVVGLLAWLSTQYSTQFDWTAGHRQTLSDASRKVLDLLKGRVTVTAYAREGQQSRQPIRDQVERYSRYKKDLTLAFVNPDTHPDKVRQLGISVDGELIVEYQGRTEKIQEPGETALTNALQRLATASERHLVFLEGHGERSPQGQANHDLKHFADELGRKGFIVSMVSLAANPAIPDNTDVLVLAGPRTNYLPGEIALIEAYVRKGGNLWWLADPGDLHGLSPLAEQLGIKFLPGTVVDASTQLLGIDDPTFALVVEYPLHPITQDFHEMTLFPSAAALEKSGPGGPGKFTDEPLLSTLERSWTETGPIEGKIAFDANQGERQGPLQIGYALTREVSPPKPVEPPRATPPKPEEGNPPETSVKTESGQPPAAAGKAGAEQKREGVAQTEATKNPEEKKPAENSKSEEPNPIQQRIVVIGDGDFLSNTYLGNGGNLDLGVNIVQWLSHGDALINIPAKTAPDRKLQLSSVASGAIAGGFLFVLPLALVGTGVAIWFQRRRR